MKHILLTLFITLISFPVFAESAYDRVIKSGKIKCGYGVWDPFINYDFKEEKPVGLVVDLMENIASKINLELEWPEETGWANMPTALQNKKIDVVCSTFWNTPAHHNVAFTDPLYYTALHAYTREGSAQNFKSLDDINRPDVRISTQDGDFSYTLAKRLFPKAQIVSVSSTNPYADILMQIAHNKADIAIYVDSNVRRFNQNNEKKLERLKFTKPIGVFGNSYAVSIHETALKEVLNTAVRNLIQTGEIEDLTREFREKYPDEIILPLKPYEVLK